MGLNNVKVLIKGRPVSVDAIEADNREIIVTGSIIRLAKIKAEWYEGTERPELLIRLIQKIRLKADLFTFMQRLPETVPKFNYYMEWDNVAALNIENFDYWWEKQIPKQTRNHVRRAQKSGVVVKIAKFDDEFVQGISEIYNESPIRQGKPFWHYKMDLESIQRTHSTYLNSSDFIGAYIDGELIGFIKMVYVGETARTMQIIAKNAHRDKAPTNALLAKAIEICSGKGVKYLVYGRYDYGKIGSKSLEVFKSENGFKEVLIPRYYIPLCLKGKLILTMKLHQGFKEILPEKTIAFMLDLRKKWFMKKYDQA